MRESSFFSKRSIFRNVPAGLRDDQRAWLDAVRGTCETAHVAYQRLLRTLRNRKLYALEKTVMAPARALLCDVRTFVDAVQRLRKILSSMSKFFGPAPRGSRQGPPPNAYADFKLARRIFESKLDGVEDVRHGTQHLEDKLQDIAGMKIPVWGALEWVVVMPKDQGKPDVHFCSLVLGYIFNGTVTPEVDRLANIPTIANRIKLRAHGKKLDLTEIRVAMEGPVKAIDALFKPQFAGLPTLPIDVYTRFVFRTAPPPPKLEATGTTS